MYFLHSDNKLMLEFAWLELELRKVAWITWQTWSTLGCVQCSNLGWGRADGMMDAYLWKLFLIIYGLHFGKYGVEYYQLRHHENFEGFTGRRMDLGLILLISNMIILRNFASSTLFLSVSVQGPASFGVSETGPLFTKRD